MRSSGVTLRSMRGAFRASALFLLVACGAAAAPENEAQYPDDSDAGADAAIAFPEVDGAMSADAHTEAAADRCAAYLDSNGPPSAWARATADGHIAYKTLDSNGDRILDFSFAGYHAGGVAIPDVVARKTVGPSNGDDTAAIQAAIDAVSQLPLVNGSRGAVVLAPGTFEIDGTLQITASGVVLRGSGSGAGGTIVNAAGTARRIFNVHGAGNPVPSTTSAAIVDSYVPSGATSFHVDDASKLAAFDTVLVQRPVTAAWVKYMGMDTLVRNGTVETWIAPGTMHVWDRVITAIAGNEVTIDVPISDSMDAKYTSPPGASLVKFTFPGRISEVGIEDIRFVSKVRAAGSEFTLVRFDGVADGWMRRVVAHDFANGIWLGPTVKRMTVQDVDVTHDPTTYVTSEAPFDFWIDGAQTLVQRSTSSGGNKIWYYATQDDTRGPNVLLDFTGAGTASHVTAHQRWATGLLIDNAHVTGGATLGNNGTLGNGEGWSMGWGVLWNTTSDVLVQAPPGAMNWSIGSTGSVVKSDMPGTYESMNVPVGMKSLYRAQLCVRLGPAAVAAIAQ